MKNILVTGGAGYIGSFMTKRLLEEGNIVSVLDSLERGHEKAIDKRATFINGNILDKDLLKDLFNKTSFDAVIHFAGYISMGESMERPGLYFENNTTGVVTLLDVMIQNNVKKIIFSSTAGVYGNPLQTPIPESHPKSPTNPYGESKLMVEHVLSWYKKIYGFSYAALRYFNASGAALDGAMGEAHNPESHIIPKAIHAALTKEDFTLFGNDYDTKDGSAIRDYIHVLDLVEAHVLALKKLEEQGEYIYNVGTGKGYSNKEVITMVKKICGIDFNVTIGNRRQGDANILIADPTLITNELHFLPKYSSLETIVETAWKWHKKNSK